MRRSMARPRPGYATRGASLPTPTYPAKCGDKWNALRCDAAPDAEVVVEILASLDPIPEGRDSLRTSDRSDERRDEVARRRAARAGTAVAAIGLCLRLTFRR